MSSLPQDTDICAPSNPISAVEFFRNCYALMPAGGQNHQTFLVKEAGKKTKPRLFCSCSKGSYADCSHGRLLKSGFENIQLENADPWGFIQKQVLWKLLSPLASKYPYPIDSVHIKEDKSSISIIHKSGFCLCEYSGQKDDRKRLACRFNPRGDGSKLSRHYLLERAAGFVLSDMEKEMLRRGNKTTKQACEESVWFRLAYHCWRESQNSKIDIRPYVDHEMKCFELHVYRGKNSCLCKIRVPNSCVPDMIASLRRHSIVKPGELVYPSTVTLLFELKRDKAKTTIIPAVCIDVKGSNQTIEVESDLLFANMAYLKDPGLFVRFDQDSSKLLASRWGERKVIENDELAQFLEMHGDIFSRPPAQDTSSTQQDLFALSAPESTFDRFINMPFIKRFERVDITAGAIDRDWCYLSVDYRIGQASVSLEQLLEARAQNKRYLVSDEGLIDTSGVHIGSLIDQTAALSNKQIKVSRAAVLQLSQSQTININIGGEEKLAAELRGLVDFSPVKPLKSLDGYLSTLRSYQKLGVQWLLFLYDNRFGGLLCDDMGLGKTHQILAFFIALREQRQCVGRFLVVCPTTVISHWKRLIDRFAPGLKAAVYHGSTRSSQDLKQETDILITSYGVMRNDIGSLSEIPFSAAVFDEAHNLKNVDTLASRSASQIRSSIKIGISGTPVENSLWDLKSLMDLVMPGYMGTGGFFEENFQQPIEIYRDEQKKARLQSIIAPFTLRRIKDKVLDELPEKIEDIRTCELLDQQVHLYREAIESRKEKVLDRLRDKSSPVPFVHIFAVLNILKQICAHPAVLAKKPAEYEYYDSGKWELFKELLAESLESGQKVVVFTQYIHMIGIMERYLKSLNVGCVQLKGSTRNRDKVVERFNNDPACRVFIGSLLAGGVGIDLTAASVVIHYDRWWNAAKEDQATDRVYRIGQKKGVQIFKLVTEGTLEEKISSIIEKKKKLSDIIGENSADQLKQFSREELLELLEYNPYSHD